MCVESRQTVLPATALVVHDAVRALDPATLHAQAQAAVEELYKERRIGEHGAGLCGRAALLSRWRTVYDGPRSNGLIAYHEDRHIDALRFIQLQVRKSF